MANRMHGAGKLIRDHVRIAREGFPFIAGGLAMTGMGAMIDTRVALLPLVATGFFSYFFRDPERTPLSPAEYLYAPADGCVMFVEEVDESRFLHAPAYHIAIFLSVFNVHINRGPAQGTVQYREYVPGRFRAAWQNEAEPCNEHQYLGIETPRGPILITQVAGLLARRIVCRPKIGEQVACGARIGMIKFSSRTDVYFPQTMARPLVSTGMPVVGAETPVGKYR